MRGTKLTALQREAGQDGFDSRSEALGLQTAAASTGLRAGAAYMSKRDQTVFQLITALVVTASLLNDWIQSQLSGLFPGAEIAIPVGAFVLLYRGLVILYSKVLWPWVHRADYVGGRWAFALHNHVTDARFYGAFHIEQGLEGLDVSGGITWRHGEEPSPSSERGRWTSLAASLRDGSLVVLFDMVGRRGASGVDAPDVQGVILLRVERDNGRPTRLVGRFYDHQVRAGLHGTINCHRVAALTRRRHHRLAFSMYGQ